MRDVVLTLLALILIVRQKSDFLSDDQNFFADSGRTTKDIAEGQFRLYKVELGVELSENFVTQR